jgi:hypothetical protein
MYAAQVFYSGAEQQMRNGIMTGESAEAWKEHQDA